jgi:DNA mismatch repair protein MutL
LKSIGTEMAHIADTVSGLAVAWPEVQFRLAHNGRIVRDLPAADPFDRAAGVLGLGSDLHPVALELEGVAVEGWVSSPRVHRRSPSALFIFVNRRLVRDRLVQHALFQGYTQRLVKGQFPLAVLFIGLPFDQVDVNVHPAKTEVRFARSNSVHEAVRRAVAQALYDRDRPGFRQKAPETNQVGEEKGVFPEGTSSEGVFSPDDRGWKPLPQKDDLFGRSTGDEGREPHPQPLSSTSFASNLQPQASRFSPPTSNLQPPTSFLQAEIWEKRGFGGMRVIGQLKNAYILCEAEEGLVLIDQHAAHERVLFEQLGRAEGGGSQVLLVPETVELGFREARALEACFPTLKEAGFEVEPFGGATVVVKAVPAALAGREAGPLIAELAAAAAEAEGAPAATDLLERFRHITACHAAIRAGQVLTLPQMTALLRQMDDCANFSHCPHGRPTWVSYDLGVIERAFKRT